mmetsp:Transcript_663/g.1456  ORF Transcript_663/g.1456 Transcript_663/m.1456 type:complete len:226 (+) Transcript_663:457-1134(+)
MRMSRNTRSGLWAWVSSTASRPFLASATISSSGQTSVRRLRSCSRIRRSSSARTARMGVVFTRLPSLCGLRPAMLVQTGSVLGVGASAGRRLRSTTNSSRASRISGEPSTAPTPSRPNTTRASRPPTISSGSATPSSSTSGSTTKQTAPPTNRPMLAPSQSPKPLLPRKISSSLTTICMSGLWCCSSAKPPNIAASTISAVPMNRILNRVFMRRLLRRCGCGRAR